MKKETVELEVVDSLVHAGYTRVGAWELVRDYERAVQGEARNTAHEELIEAKYSYPSDEFSRGWNSGIQTVIRRLTK